MKKQPVHGCMPSDHIICRAWEHTNRALIFQSVPGCPKCPTVPAFRGRDSGTAGQTVENQSSKKVMSNYSLQKYKGTSTRHTCPNCGDRRSFAYYVDESGTPLHSSKRLRVSLYAQTVFSRPPRMPDRWWFLFRQAMYGAEAQATAATDSHRLHTATLCGEIAELA